MVKLYDRVRIKSNGAAGDIVDIDDNGKITVEGDSGETEEGAIIGGEFPIYYVSAEDVEKIDDAKTKRRNLSKRVAMF